MAVTGVAMDATAVMDAGATGTMDAANVAHARKPAARIALKVRRASHHRAATNRGATSARRSNSRLGATTDRVAAAVTAARAAKARVRVSHGARVDKHKARDSGSNSAPRVSRVSRVNRDRRASHRKPASRSPRLRRSSPPWRAT